MADITFKGAPIQTTGDLPPTGEKAPDFQLTSSKMQEVKLSDYRGKKVILNIFPSVDTGICAASVRQFNKEAAGLSNTVVFCISKDLPFAHKRFCAAEGIENVESLSEFKDFNFSEAYKTTMTGGPLAGLMSRVVMVIDEEGKVTYREQVPEIVQEPDYSKALEAARQ